MATASAHANSPNLVHRCCEILLLAVGVQHLSDHAYAARVPRPRKQLRLGIFGSFTRRGDHLGLRYAYYSNMLTLNAVADCRIIPKKIFSARFNNVCCVERVGLSWLLQEYYELRNRYNTMTFLPDRSLGTQRLLESSGSDSYHNGSISWPWQKNLIMRIKGVMIAHYNDPWNLLDLLIVILILWHCLLSTVWNDDWDASGGLDQWSELYPTRTVARTRLVLGFTAIFAWFRCLGLMKVHPKLGPMVTITLIMLGNILEVDP